MDPVERIKQRQETMRVQNLQRDQERKETAAVEFETHVLTLVDKIVATHFLGCQVYRFEGSDYAGMPLFGTNSDSEPRGKILHLLVADVDNYLIVEDERVRNDSSIKRSDYTFAPVGITDLHGSHFDPRAAGSNDEPYYSQDNFTENTVEIQTRMDWFVYHKDREI